MLSGPNCRALVLLPECADGFMWSGGWPTLWGGRGSEGQEWVGSECGRRSGSDGRGAKKTVPEPSSSIILCPVGEGLPACR